MKVRQRCFHGRVFLRGEVYGHAVASFEATSNAIQMLSFAVSAMLQKVLIFVEANRHFTGRLTAFDGTTLTLDLSAIKQKGKAKKAVTSQTVEIAFSNIEKANLVAEI